MAEAQGAQPDPADIWEARAETLAELLQEAKRRLDGEFPAFADMKPEQRVEAVSAWIDDCIQSNEWMRNLL